MLKNGQTIVFILLHKIQASVSYFVFVISLIINRFSYNTHNMTSTYTLACNDTFEAFLITGEAGATCLSGIVEFSIIFYGVRVA